MNRYGDPRRDSSGTAAARDRWTGARPGSGSGAPPDPERGPVAAGFAKLRRSIGSVAAIAAASVPFALVQAVAFSNLEGVLSESSAAGAASRGMGFAVAGAAALVSSVGWLLTLACVFVRLDLPDHESFATVLSLALRRLPALFATYLAVALLAGIGLIVLVIPGLYLGLRLFWPYGDVLVPGASPVEAVRRCWRATRGKALAVLGFQLRAGAALFVVAIPTFPLFYLVWPESGREASSPAYTALAGFVSVILYGLLHAMETTYLARLDALQDRVIVVAGPEAEVDPRSTRLSFGVALAGVGFVFVHIAAAVLATSGANGVVWSEVSADLLLWVCVPTLLVMAGLQLYDADASAGTRGRAALIALVVLLPVQWLHHQRSEEAGPAVSTSRDVAAARRTIVDGLGDACRADCGRDPSGRSCAEFCRCVEREMRRFSTDRLRNLEPDPDQPRTRAFIDSISLRCRD